jgi:hypothetical protein
MTTTATPPTPLIAWSVLGHILLDSTLITLALTILFSVGIVALSWVRRPGATVVVRGASGLLAALAGAGTLAALVWGFHFVITK